MKRIHHPLPHLACLILASAMALPCVRAESRQFSLPSYLTNPGGVIEVPLTLDNAAGLAAIQVQVNFNPDVIELLSINPGPLGDAFELSQGNGDGVVILTFFRADELAGGSGRLAALRFRANLGANTQLFSELAIAEVLLADASGVLDMRQTDEILTTNGEVSVSMQSHIDTTASGLPDWWELKHGFDPFTHNLHLDPDNDGMPNLLEYAFGGNPNVADAKERGVQSTRIEHDGTKFLSISFFRRHSDARLQYRVQESTDLATWNDLSIPQQMSGPPQDMGDGTEFLNVRGTIPTTGSDAEPQGFIRVSVDRP